MIYQLHLKPLIITFYWSIQSPWKDWKKSGIMEPLLSLRNTQKMVLCQCLYAPNAVFCVVAKGPNASQGLNSSDGEGMVST